MSCRYRFHRPPNLSALPARAQQQSAPPPPPPINVHVKSSGSSCATIGIIVAIAIAVMFVLLAVIGTAIMLPAMSRAREAARRASCANNLKQMGLVLKMYAAENPDSLWVALSDEPGQLMPVKDAIVPEYLTDARVLHCPGVPRDVVDEDLFADSSYVYLGYAVRNEVEGRAFIEAYHEAIESGRGFEENLPVPAGHADIDSETIPRLHEQLPNSEHGRIPVLFDRSFKNHGGRGINVLFMDGHVEFLLEGEERFPAVAWFLDELEVLRGL